MGGLAALMSIPMGIAAAVFLTEFPRHRLSGPVRFFSDVMTGVPSVFVGLFVYTILVRQIGFGTFVGALSLAIIMLPIVVRSSEEVLRLVPGELKRASYALGATQWQTVFGVVLPTAAPGLITGSMLAVARALGETAPLVLTALARSRWCSTSRAAARRRCRSSSSARRAARSRPASSAPGRARSS